MTFYALLTLFEIITQTSCTSAWRLTWTTTRRAWNFFSCVGCEGTFICCLWGLLWFFEAVPGLCHHKGLFTFTLLFMVGRCILIKAWRAKSNLRTRLTSLHLTTHTLPIRIEKTTWAFLTSSFFILNSSWLTNFTIGWTLTYLTCFYIAQLAISFEIECWVGTFCTDTIFQHLPILTSRANWSWRALFTTIQRAFITPSTF